MLVMSAIFMDLGHLALAYGHTHKQDVIQLNFPAIFDVLRPSAVQY